MLCELHWVHMISNFVEKNSFVVEKKMLFSCVWQKLNIQNFQKNKCQSRLWYKIQTCLRKSFKARSCLKFLDFTTASLLSMSTCRQLCCKKASPSQISQTCKTLFIRAFRRKICFASAMTSKI